MKKIYKYATGEKIPEGAVYLSTVKQTEELKNSAGGIGSNRDKSYDYWDKCYLVWHYFLVEVKD